MTDNSILEPRKLYENQFKDKFKENAEEYFDNLVKESKINVDENRELVKKYKSCKNDENKVTEKMNSLKAWKTLCIVGIILSLILAFVFFAVITSTGLKVALIILCVALTILFIVLLVNLNKKLKGVEDLVKKAKEKSSKALNLCWASMNALNQLYDWTICQDIMEKTTPLIDLDPYFDPNKFEYMHEKYGFGDATNPNQSTNYVLSGNINGNPFLMLNTFNTKMSTKTYSNSITIHWTTTSRDSKGNVQTHPHSEVLTATVEKPAPIYYYDTRLVYTNDGAPNLTFSRMPTVKDNLTDKDIDKMVKKGEVELQKKTEKAVRQGGTFNAMANTKFEVMFNAKNRDNETEFRLMFTPLAQQNMTDLLQNSPYHDDFAFYKDKYLNYIFSGHSQTQNYKIDPTEFAHYDIDQAKTQFLEITTNFFKGLYFDLAPLLSIPLYQQTKTHEYIYNIPYEAYNTKYEQEVMANQLDLNKLKHPETKTEVILKTKFNSKDSDTDYLTVTAYSYKTIKHTDICSKLGGDGRIHNIPVDWYEYVPLEKESQMAMSKVETSRYKFNNSNELINKLASQKTLAYERGLLSYIVSSNTTMKDIKDKINK